LDEAEEKARLIAQVLELQNTLDGKTSLPDLERTPKNSCGKNLPLFYFILPLDLSQKVDSVKEENLKLKSENQVLGQYIENLMTASNVFQSTTQNPKKKYFESDSLFF
jgi:short coiled-coil protein